MNISKFCIYGIMLLALVLVGIYFYPISSFVTRIIFTAAILLLLIFSIIGVVFSKRRWYILAAVIIILIVAKLNLQTKEPVQDVYVDELNYYLGTKYVWGGENSMGIDCSGLVRKAMINTLFAKAISENDFSKMKLALDLWWNDCTANSLKKGFRNYTSPTNQILSVNDADTSLLRKGDMAITLDGVHVMAYAGNNEWIEADPINMEVIKKKTPSTNPWFNMPMEIVRWNILK